MDTFVFKKATTAMLSLAMSAAVVPQFTINADATANGVDDFVTRCYEVALDREPDKTGFDYWCSELNQGKSKEEVV